MPTSFSAATRKTYCIFLVNFGMVISRVALVLTLFQERLLASRFSTTYCLISLPPLSFGGCQCKSHDSAVTLSADTSCGADGLSVSNKNILCLNYI
jgi:hypothetical protein